MSVNDRVRELVEPIVEDFDLYLFDLDFVGGRLRVTLDTKEASSPGEGVTSGVVARVTRQISRELDAEDPIASGYTLEVSTPGVERRLQRPDHFRRSLGETVSVKLNPGAEIDGERRVSGVLAAADDDTFALTGETGENISVPYRDVSKARTVFEWGPAPKPGSTRSKAASSKSAKTKTKATAADSTSVNKIAPSGDASPDTATPNADSSQDKAGAQ